MSKEQNEFGKMQGSSIIRELIEGQERALKTVFELYNQRLMYFSMQFVYNKEVAEELVSDAFVKVWNLRENFEDIEKLQAFLYISVKNASLNYLRTTHAQRMTEPIDSLFDLQSQDSDTLLKIIKTELINSIYAEMCKLPEKQREVFVLSFVEELNAEEIGKKLGMSLSAVYANRSRAIATLRGVLRLTNSTYLLFFLILFSVKSFPFFNFLILSQPGFYSCFISFY